MRALRRGCFFGSMLIASAVVLLGCAASSPASQSPGKVARVGFLVPESPADTATGVDQAFRDGLHELGYTEGRSVVIEWRYLEGRREAAAGAAKDLVNLPVDVIVVRGDLPARAAMDATSSIPIVMALNEDPVGSGLVQSLARPGGNVTGLSTLGHQLSEKRVELLKESVPTVTLLAVLWDPSDQSSVATWRGMESAAKVLKTPLQSLEVRNTEEFELAKEAVARERPDALIVSGGFLLNGILPRRIVELAGAHNLPVMAGAAGAVRSGALMYYGANSAEAHRRAAYYVDRILKGTKPADLPVEQPTTFDFIINMKTAKMLGLAIPYHVLLQATEVIE